MCRYILLSYGLRERYDTSTTSPHDEGKHQGRRFWRCSFFFLSRIGQNKKGVSDTGDIEPKKVAVYIRIGGKVKTNFHIQKQNLLQYAKEQGLTNLKIYQDIGFCGTDTSRPAFHEMMKDINNGKIRLLLVRDMTRICRGFHQMHDFMNTLKTANVKIKTLDETHRISKNEMHLMKAIKKYMNQKHER